MTGSEETAAARESIRGLKGVDTLVADSAWNLVGRILANVAYFLFVTIVVKALGDKRYGEFTIFLMAAQFLYIVFLVWLQFGIVRFGREETLEHGKINRSFTAYVMLAAPIMAVQIAALVLFRERILGYFRFADVYLYVLIVFFIGNYLTELFNYLLQAIGELKLLAAAQATEKILPFLLLGLVVWLAPALKVIHVVLLVMSGYAASVILAASSGVLKRCLPLRGDAALFRRYLAYSAPLLLSAVMAYLLDWIDIAIIRGQIDIETVGRYNFCLQIFRSFVQVNMVAATIFYPLAVTLVAKRRHDLLARFASEIPLVAMIVYALVLNVVWIVATMLFGYLFGGAPTEYVLAIGVLLACVPLILFSGVLGHILVSYEQTWSYSLLSIFSLALKICVSMTLILHFRLGVVGAAISTLCYFISNVCCFAVVLRRRLTFEIRRNLLFIVLLAACPALYWLIGNLAISFLLNMTLIVLFLFFARPFTEENLDYLLQLDIPEGIKRVIRRARRHLGPFTRPA